MVNYILARHDYPMIVVRSRDKQNYKEKGYIEAKDNTGSWRVLITPSV